MWTAAVAPFVRPAFPSPSPRGMQRRPTAAVALCADDIKATACRTGSHTHYGDRCGSLGEREENAEHRFGKGSREVGYTPFHLTMERATCRAGRMSRDLGEGRSDARIACHVMRSRS